mgnify:CR=1 FL=1
MDESGFDFQAGEFRFGKSDPDALDALIEKVKRISCDDPEPPWWNHDEEDVGYTSKTAFALLGLVLGNTLGIDLKPLLRQARAIKLCEGDIEF